MNKIHFVDYIYDTNGKVSEAIVTYENGQKKIVKTPYELNEIQQQMANQNRQILIETPPAGKPI